MWQELGDTAAGRLRGDFAGASPEGLEDKRMVHVFHSQDLHKGAIAAVEFEGEASGAGISFFIGDLEAGQGPGLHRHPYPETCIIHSGQVALMVDGEEVVGGAGDVVVIRAGTPHSFIAIGDERFKAICIHAADRFVIEWLDE